VGGDEMIAGGCGAFFAAVNQSSSTAVYSGGTFEGLRIMRS